MLGFSASKRYWAIVLYVDVQISRVCLNLLRLQILSKRSKSKRRGQVGVRVMSAHFEYVICCRRWCVPRASVEYQ
nr:MAG TPA: hypothetical protein [Caudoviricetes sp.]